MPLTLFFLLDALWLLTLLCAAVPSTEGNAATMITLIYAGWLPHDMCPSGAASIYLRESRVFSCQ